ncbi:hypothetical protein ACFPK9_01185 [Rubritalea spongiae]|uniref:Uncharacterized protein n=1 Tax=Rubritalea spongiae TaxID=430797 RepID=A0ABW5E4V4_9BACT
MSGGAEVFEENFDYTGESLFLNACLAEDVCRYVRDLSEDALAELGRFIQGHAEQKSEGIAGLVYSCALVELGERALELVDAPVVDEREALERAEGFDEAMGGSLIDGNGGGA